MVSTPRGAYVENEDEDPADKVEETEGNNR